MSNTYWEYEGQRITLDDVQRFISWHNITAKPIALQALSPVLTVKTEPARVDAVDRSYPIIVIMKDQKPLMILDGHHRVRQAQRAGDAQINAFVIDYRSVPLMWRSAITAS